VDPTVHCKSDRTALGSLLQTQAMQGDPDRG
jgi:hypothetical protein